MSILRPWVQSLGLREQGVLLTAIRGCDLAPKYPLDSQERTVTAFIRWAVCVPFDEREVDSEPGCFMQSKLPDVIKPANWEHYPLHYVLHMVHALEIIGYCYIEAIPSPTTIAAREAYFTFCKAFHFVPESKHQMHVRLSEDRIANGSVVQK